MPQFDTTFWMGQIFWLMISFWGLYLGVQFVIFPMYQRIFFKRDKQIQGLLTQAERLTKETEKLEKQLERNNIIQEQRRKEHFNQAHQNAFLQMQTILKQTEERLLKSFKRTAHKIEVEERDILQKAPDFVTQVIKGGK